MRIYLAGIYLLKVSNRNNRTRCEICSVLSKGISCCVSITRFYVIVTFHITIKNPTYIGSHCRLHQNNSCPIVKPKAKVSTNAQTKVTYFQFSGSKPATLLKNALLTLKTNVRLSISEKPTQRLLLHRIRSK